MKKYLFIFYLSAGIILRGFCQIQLNPGLPDIRYATPKEYEIGGITVEGVKYLDKDVLVQLTGLNTDRKSVV